MKRALIFLVAMSLVACGSGGGDEDIITGLDIRYDGSGETDSILPDIDGDVPFRPDTGDCEPATSQYGFLDLCDGTVKDTNTGLIWEKGYGEPAGTQPNDIKRYCNVLKLGYNGGSLFEDWRTPTIDELRTLILGCDKTALGGECAILHDCSTESCLGVDPNLAPNCKCSNNSGPVFFPDDDPNDEFETWCYLDDSFVPWCNLYYSQTDRAQGDGGPRAHHVRHVLQRQGRHRSAHPAERGSLRQMRPRQLESADSLCHHNQRQHPWLLA